MTNHLPNYSKQVLVLIFLSSLFKLIIGSIIELSNDEVYYVSYSYFLQWNYFDHPPGIAILLKIFSANLKWNNEFFVRLGPVVCGATSTWLIYLIGKKFYNQLKGWIAAVLFTASGYGTVVSGLLLLPDAPLMPLWLWSFYLANSIFQNNNKQTISPMLMLLWGVVTGGAIVCKLNGIFLLVGFLIYVLLHQRSLLRSYYFYFSLALTGLICFPVFTWDPDSTLASYSFHSRRISFGLNKIDLGGFIRQVSGEIAYINPICFVLLLWALASHYKNRLLFTVTSNRIIFCFALPLICCIWFFSLYSDTLPHWSGPAWILLLFVAADFIGNRSTKNRLFPLYPPVLHVALLFPFVLLLTVAISSFSLPIIFNKQEKKKLGESDLLLECSGWKNFGISFKNLYENDIFSKKMKTGAVLISDYWFPAAHLDYYVAKPASINLLTIGSLTNIHHFATLNKIRPGIRFGDDAYLILISNYFNEPPIEITRCFKHIDEPEKIEQVRAGLTVRYFWIYRLKNYIGGITEDGVIIN
ncbi:MAG: ArnT family glycosyltransferase [Chitinophagaceae bacterium]